MKTLLTILTIALLTSCAATYDLGSMRGHYALASKPLHNEPATITIITGETSATITTVDQHGVETVVHYSIAKSGQLVPADTDTPRAYIIDVGDGIIYLTDIEGHRFTYTRTSGSF